MENQQTTQQVASDVQQQVQVTGFVPRPDSHLGLAIFTTLCCCLPLGVVAIFKASKVGDYYAMKQYEMAAMQSEQAKKWCMYAIIAAAIINVGWGFICLITGTSFLALFSFLG